ncbi:hypothetical protein AM501_24085 [Aneurinibacillus migulanus]|uniref:HsdM family class I SAM-dependent methyltransferase n=1 Tax=Aneurinibacillus migulanus TaxID=47500 RepID=UPI0005B84098|nr:N-6 DNA methylase [Aneurinibacillus migulanus]KIV58911.1 hypothetical protein TS64_03895 [Aneurinibacillus migulanus]KPD05857.1 hypothetical protein AM501_24085 [Aneurinibacillus migulanus]CEH28285.1 Putative type I restriction-modification system m ethyltransferase subunit [Aneurinibacillus migulanus]
MGRKERKRIVDNQAALALLDKEHLTNEDITFLKQSFSGIGGLTAGGWNNGQFFTPQNVAKFVVEMLDITGGRVLEPSCGSGAFIEHLPVTTEIVGVEMMRDAVRVAERCYPHTTIIHDDFFNVELPNGSFDAVIGNPPFGLKIGFDFACKKKLKSEAAFVERSLHLLKPGGVLGMIVPDSLLGNSREQPWRRWVLENYRLLGVVSLPIETFYHVGTSVKTSFIMIQNDGMSKEERGNYNIFMAESKKIGWDKRGRSCGSDLNVILATFREMRSTSIVQDIEPMIINEEPEKLVSDVILHTMSIPNTPDELVLEKNGQYALF